MLAAGGMYANMWLQQQAEENEGAKNDEFAAGSAEEIRDENTEE